MAPGTYLVQRNCTPERSCDKPGPVQSLPPSTAAFLLIMHAQKPFPASGNLVVFVSYCRLLFASYCIVDSWWHEKHLCAYNGARQCGSPQNTPVSISALHLRNNTTAVEAIASLLYTTKGSGDQCPSVAPRDPIPHAEAS